MNYKFNLIKSQEDPRDFVYSWIVKSTQLPSKYNRESECSPIRNQGNWGFCWTFAGDGIKEWQEWKERSYQKPILSPLFIAVEGKKIDGITDSEGSTLKTVFKVLYKKGICYETTYPYSGYKGNLQFPTVPQEAYDEAVNFKIKNYAKLYTLNDIRSALINSGLVLAGIVVADNFLIPENGFVNKPEGNILGSHAIVICGYDDELTFTYKNGITRKGFLRIRNSWGETYGDKGYAWLPYDFYNGKLDIGMSYFFEAWSSVDASTILPVAKEIVMWIGKNNALIDGNEVILDQPPIIDQVTWRTLVPLRFIAENAGYGVQWIENEQKIILSK
jgi:C1A family cysteine protease